MILSAAPCCRRPPFINLQIYRLSYEHCVILEFILSLLGCPFVTLGKSRLRREARVRTKWKKIEKHSNFESKCFVFFTMFLNSSSCFVLFCCWFLEEPREVFFLAPWWPKCPKWGLLGGSFQDMPQQSGKLKTVVPSCTPNTTF